MDWNRQSINEIDFCFGCRRPSTEHLREFFTFIREEDGDEQFVVNYTGEYEHLV